MALLQFGTTLVFGVPPLWNNENQPDPNVRKAQAILGKTYSLFNMHCGIDGRSLHLCSMNSIPHTLLGLLQWASFAPHLSNMLCITAHLQYLSQD